MGWQWHQLDHMQITCTLLQTDNHASTSPLSFYRSDALPDTQPTASKHWRQNANYTIKFQFNQVKKKTWCSHCPGRGLQSRTVFQAHDSRASGQDAQSYVKQRSFHTTETQCSSRPTCTGQQHNDRFTALCPGLPGWAGTRRNTHHPPSWSSSNNLYQLLPSTTIHSILLVQITCLAIFMHNLSPCPLWSTSWSGALHLIFHTLLHLISVFFSQHFPMPSQPTDVHIKWEKYTKTQKKKQKAGKSWFKNKKKTHKLKT